MGDGLDRGLAVEPGGAGDGAIAGMDPGAPVGAKAAGDLAQDDGGPEFAFADVVGRRYAAVFENDEEL